MTRVALYAAAAFLMGALTAFAGTTVLGISSAEASGTRVICSQMPQKPGQIDEVYVANFMSEQLAHGRTNFTSVNGASTVMCAW